MSTCHRTHSLKKMNNNDKNKRPQCNAFTTEHPALGNSLNPPPEHPAQGLVKEELVGAGGGSLLVLPAPLPCVEGGHNGPGRAASSMKQKLSHVHTPIFSPGPCEKPKPLFFNADESSSIVGCHHEGTAVLHRTVPSC